MHTTRTWAYAFFRIIFSFHFLCLAMCVYVFVCVCVALLVWSPLSIMRYLYFSFVSFHHFTFRFVSLFFYQLLLSLCTSVCVLVCVCCFCIHQMPLGNSCSLLEKKSKGSTSNDAVEVALLIKTRACVFCHVDLSSFPAWIRASIKLSLPLSFYLALYLLLSDLLCVPWTNTFLGNLNSLQFSDTLSVICIWMTRRAKEAQRKERTRPGVRNHANCHASYI